MKIIAPISALIPWESYDYQGHIALYVSLENIYELLIKGEKLNNYELQIEGEEDFSLLKNNKYLSLHQVKAGKVKLDDNDKFTFLIELIENDTADGYFHINTSSKIPNDFCKKTLEQINNLLVDLKKKVILKEELGKDAELDDYLVYEEVPKNATKASVYSLIKYAVNTEHPEGYDIENVKKAVTDVANILNDYSKKIKSTIEDSLAVTPDTEYLEIYPKRFDTNSEIKEEAAGIIKKILLQVKPEYEMFLDDNYVKLVYDHLFLFMKGTITNHLKTKSSNDRCLMSFEEILRVISINYSDELNTKEYQYYLVLRAIADVYAMYPQEARTRCTEVNCHDCSKNNSCNLNIQIKEIFSKESMDQKNIIHNLILCEPEKGKSNNLPSDSLISDLLCDLLREITAMKLSDNNIVQAIKDNSEVYRLTLDESRNPSEIQKKIRQFISVEADKSLLYETDVLITDRLDEQNLIFNEDKINILGEKELEELRKYDVSSTSIDEMKKESNRPKVIRLINKDKAIGELYK